MDKGIKLTTKFVGDIEGAFFVPSYQRGYRWGETEVVRLLDDIYNTEGQGKYCLQPIVVRRNGEQFELIDGQQRLTTLYLIYKYMNIASNEFLDGPAFTLSYKTREKSEEFLKNLDVSRKDENIDFWFISNAYESIQRWFEEKKRKSTISNVNKYFDEVVKVIWYEVDESEDAIGLFTRLNIGKIPLTSAELVKAMFLNQSTAGMDYERQEEISLQWDNMEKELHNNALWFFLTNQTSLRYQTRIDLVLDLIAGKTPGERETYYTFFKFDELRKQSPLDAIWRKIQQTFLILKDWFEDHELYHKIGYLIASEYKSLQEVYELADNKTKDAFRSGLDECIRTSIAIRGNYADLSYEKAADRRKITNLLLLFNVESVRNTGAHSQWFPFEKYKYGNGGKIVWSLEHIHAQQSEGMRTQESWKEWLRLHLPSVRAVSPQSTALIDSMQVAANKDRLDRAEFDELQQQVIEVLSVRGNREYIHSIGNLALLSATDNAALNNSTFDVKRNEIIDMDKRGQYIPFCTRMVFLKYYTDSAENQLHFWGQGDRNAYIEAMNRTLKPYLSEAIITEKEAE